MFVEPSPVPRFRNEPPAPPPTPPYLSVLVQPGDLFANASSQEGNAQNAQNEPMTPSLRPSVASMTRKPRLVFQSPLYRGQAIPFALHNTLPDDHLIIFKFLTSSSSNNSSHASAAHTHATATMHASSDAHHQERYYVRPSSGKIDAFQADILLILNQIPPLASGATLKDKILVRWAVVQRGTQVEQWVQQQLTEKTRRKWLEMLLETWPDQVMERKTRLSIRFT
ncbi:hypothetical protein BC940DRAFT_291767 [Gongronella butleri]|nr:hypothetical protein BC940DRAFT_291767 [Gongronella butleri]